MTRDWDLRPTAPPDEDFLWRMLFFASHSNDEPGVDLEDIRSNPDLIGYIEGWKEAGHFGVIAHEPTRSLGAAWLRMLRAPDTANPVFVDAATPELAVAVEPGEEGRGLGTSMIARLLRDASGRHPAVVLSSRADNPAVRLYERLGFVVVSEMVNRVGTKSVKMIART